jgi:hypothetical protein
MPVDPLEPLRVQANFGRVDLGLQSTDGTTSFVILFPGWSCPPSLAPILRSARHGV